MKLYHGTSAANLGDILNAGILPRGAAPGNWAGTVQSCPTAVYLTTAYAIHYASVAAAQTGGALLLLEVDADMLAPDLMAPDEDFLAQVERFERAEPHRGEDLETRTMALRDSTLLFRTRWLESLRNLGTCTYHGPVPPATISRYAIIPAVSELARTSDPTITLANYRLLGGYYRQLTRRAFGDDVDVRDGLSVMRDRTATVAQVSRAGTVVVDRVTGIAHLEEGTAA